MLTIKYFRSLCMRAQIATLLQSWFQATIAERYHVRPLQGSSSYPDANWDGFPHGEMARLGTLYLPPSLSPSLPLVGLAGVERATERLADGWTGGDGERGLASLAAALSIGVIGKSRGVPSLPVLVLCHLLIMSVPARPPALIPPLSCKSECCGRQWDLSISLVATCYLCLAVP